MHPSFHNSISAEIAFMDNCAILDDEKTVRVGFIQKRIKCDAFSLDRGNGKTVKVDLTPCKFAHRPTPAPNFDRGQYFTDMMERPPIVRWSIPVLF